MQVVVVAKPQYAADTMLHNAKEKANKHWATTSSRHEQQQQQQLKPTAEKNGDQTSIEIDPTTLRVANGWPHRNQGVMKDVHPHQQYYSNEGARFEGSDGHNDDGDVGNQLDAAALDNLVETEIYIKPKQCQHQLQYEGGKCLETSRQRQANCKFSPTKQHRGKQHQLQIHNKYISSIINILQCKQLTQREEQHQQFLEWNHRHQSRQQARYRQHIHRSSPSSAPRTPLYQINNSLSQDLIKIICILLLTISLPHYLLQMPLPVAAGCRNEPSRSCETVCRPRWQRPDNDKIYYHSMHHSVHDDNVTTDTFSNSSSTSVAAAPANSLPALFAAYDCRIRALVLLPDNDTYLTSLRRVIPILKVAEQYIHESGLLPSSISFDWMPHDDKCDAAYAMINVMDGIVKNCAHVIFGPTCEFSAASVGRVTKYFNSNGTPLITVGGSTFDFEMKKTTCSDEFYMLLRAGMLSFKAISDFTISVMKRYDWSHSVFFYERDGQAIVAGERTCHLMMSSLGQRMRDEDMIFSQYSIFKEPENRPDEMKREIGNKHSGKHL